MLLLRVLLCNAEQVRLVNESKQKLKENYKKKIKVVLADMKEGLEATHNDSLKKLEKEYNCMVAAAVQSERNLLQGAVDEASELRKVREFCETSSRTPISLQGLDISTRAMRRLFLLELTE